jgi:sn-glycerol 3-phosphate transport system ATP-binding protein
VSSIRVDHLVKTWGAVPAVDDVSFSIAEGQFVALLGPSGCGKSTTLRLIAGLDDASSGRIEIAGREVTSLSASKRNVSMVFQSYALFPHLTVTDNITFGLSIRGIARAERVQRLSVIAELLGLETLLDRKPNQLSGGQQQRVALGRALISGSPVCLLDEPLSNLDAQLRSEMRNEIRSLQRRLGITMLFVTHDQTEAMTMADRIVLMRNGRIEQAGAPADLYEKPSSTFVARFIGAPAMNVIDLQRIEGDYVIAGTNAVVGPAAEREFQLGLRPEHLAFVESGLPVVVESVEYFGADSVTICSVVGQRLAVRTSGRPSLTAGQRAYVAWESSTAHFFDKSTGMRRGAPI